MVCHRQEDDARVASTAEPPGSPQTRDSAPRGFLIRPLIVRPKAHSGRVAPRQSAGCSRMNRWTHLSSRSGLMCLTGRSWCDMVAAVGH